MAKSKAFKRILKITVGLIIFLTLPSLLFFGFLYFKYNEDLPEGQQGPKADALAQTMLEALNADAYQNTDYLEWTFKGQHSYKWYKTDGTCEVTWKNFKVLLDLKNQENSQVFVANQEYIGIEKQGYIEQATNYFNNDSFWLVGPYKVFDTGTERKLVTTENGKKALLVTYASGGTTPGDSYLWHLDDNGRPKSFQMWVKIIPIGGLEASWEQWITTESGALLPTFHKFLFLGIELQNIKGLNLSQ